jgi:hypothetical protein
MIDNNECLPEHDRTQRGVQRRSIPWTCYINDSVLIWSHLQIKSIIETRL